MSATELLWLHHIENFEYLSTERKSQVRRYLLHTGDLRRLASWDAGQMKEESDDG